MRGVAEGTVLVVTGGSGGVGASTVATAVAVRARRAGVEAVLVDADPWGGGLDVTLGAEQEPGLRWADLGGLHGAADGRALLDRLPSADGVPVLSFDRGVERPPPEVVVAVVGALARECELVVVDVSLDGGPVADAALDAARHVVIVADGGVRSLAALSVVATHLRVRDGRRVLPETVVCLRGRARRMGPMARVVESELGLPVLFSLADDPGVVADLAHGVPPGGRPGGALVALADEVLAWSVLAHRTVA